LHRPGASRDDAHARIVAVSRIGVESQSQIPPGFVLGGDYHRSVKPYENIVTFESMMIGFTEALNRLDAVSGDPILAYNALFESLNWAVALDERVGEHWVPDGEPLSWKWRARLGPEVELMSGVRFARNRIHHRWSDVIFASVTPSGGFRAWMWRPVEDIPEGRPDPTGEAMYRDRLQGAPVQVALNVVGGAFLALLSMLEPHTVRNPAVTSQDAVNPRGLSCCSVVHDVI
jgi:hypothetical protein